jgi:HK97 family phage portal protein
MPQHIKIIPDKQKFIGGYEYQPTPTEKHILKPEQVVHYKYVNPNSAFYGLGPLQACAVAADLSSSMNTYETSLMQNRAVPDMALVFPEDAAEPKQPEQKRIRKQFKQMYHKPGNLALLYGGAELKPIALTPREISYLQGRKATLNEIAADFGVPMSKLTTDDVNRANAEAGDYSYMKDTILPRLRRVEQKINEQILPLYDERLFCAFDNPVPEDKDFRLKQVTEHLRVGYSSINEVRQFDNLEPVDWGDVPIMPLTMGPLSLLPPEPQGPPPIPPPPKSKAQRRVPPLGHPTNFINEPLVQALRSYFAEQHRVIAARIAEDIAKSVRYSTKLRIDDYLASWFDWRHWNGELHKRTESFVRYTLHTGGQRALKQIKPDGEFHVENPKVYQALEKYRTGRVVGINGTVVKKLRKALAEGMEEGEGAATLKNRVGELYAGLEANQSKLIARTETIWAWNEGAVQGYIQSGVVEAKEWLTAADERSCGWCEAMDGKTVGIEGSYFDKGGSMTVGEEGKEQTLSFEYEDIGHPPLHPQCRCCIIPVLREI